MTHAEYMRAWYKENPLGKNPHKKVCLFCGQGFLARLGGRKYCSKSCAVKKPPVEKVCRWCKQNFTVRPYREASAKFCSFKCRSHSRRGVLAANWQGGKVAERNMWMGRHEYKEWRVKVFERDNFTCVWCGDDRGGNLEADHIKPWCLYPDLRFDINNGRTLCTDCHKQTDTWGRKVFKFKRELSV